MTKLKTIATTLTLIGVIFMGASNARAGILMSDLTNDDQPQSCTETISKDVKEKANFGIIVYLSSALGIDKMSKWFDRADDNVECGIIVH